MSGLAAGGDMSSMMSDPKFLDSAMSMMRGMDEESLTSMMLSSGMCASKEQATTMAKQASDRRLMIEDVVKLLKERR